MPSSLDPADLSPADRTRELATLLATALLRLHRLVTTPEHPAVSAPLNIPESVRNDLDVSA